MSGFVDSDSVEVDRVPSHLVPTYDGTTHGSVGLTVYVVSDKEKAMPEPET